MEQVEIDNKKMWESIIRHYRNGCLLLDRCIDLALQDQGLAVTGDDEIVSIEPESQRMVSAEAKEAMYDKPAWSEEDACLLDNCISLIEDIPGTEDEQNWLKSIRPQSQWKPSDEEMKVLEYSTRLFSDTERGNYYSGILEYLYEELKKLREE